MPLILPVLSGGLTRVLSQPGDNAAAKASEFASAYQSYAAPAMAGVLLPIFTGSEQPLFMNQLVPVFNNSQSTAVQFANAIASAVESYWFLPPVPFAGGPAVGAVTGFAGKAGLIAQLIGILSNQYDNAAQPAADIASALDTATKTVIVTFAPPPGSTATLV